MSNNMTRKGLAIGVSAALSVAGLSVAPAAYAAETLALAPSAGTLYTTLTTSGFTLDAGFAGTESSAAAGTLKFRVKNAAGVGLDVDVVEGADTTEVAYAYGTTSSDLLSGGATSSTDFIAKTSAGTPEIGAKQSLTLVPTAHTADVTVTVQAWLDLDADGVIDTNEATSPERTVIFYDQANVGLGALEIKPLTLGSTAMTVVVTTSPALNYRQITAGDIKIQGLKNVSTTSGSAANVAWDTTYSDFRASVTLGENVAAGTTYGAQLQITNGSALVDTGAAAYQTVGSGDVTAIATVDNRQGTSITNDYLRAGSGTFQVYTDVTVGATKSKVVPVTFTISETGANTLHSGTVVTAGGKELKNSSVSTTQEIEVVVNSVERTETTGRAILTISYTGLKDGNTLIVKAKAVGASSVVADSTGDTFTGQDDIATALVDDVANQLRVVKGSSMSVNYTLVDQFGQTPTGSFRLVMSEDGTTPNYSTNVAVTAGKATFTVVENSTANSNYSLTATLQKLGTDGVTWSAANSVTEVTAISAVSAATVGSITISADDDGVTDGTAVAMYIDDNASGDSEITQHLTYLAYTGSTLTITVKDTTGALLAGAPVTLSAAGLQFVFSKSDAGKIYGDGSITVTTNTVGVATVLVASNKSGKQTVTVTSGATSKTQAITYAAAANDTGYSWTLTAPAYAAAGSTFKVTAKLTDYYGNPVKVLTANTPNVETSYTGPGIVFGSLPSETNAAGELSFSVLLGSNDTGTATITVNYDLDGDGVADYDDFSKSISVTVGAAPATAKVNVGSFNGKLVVYANGYNGKKISWKVGGKWGTAVATSDTARFARVTPRKGVTVSVQIYVDGVLTLTKSVVTK